MSAQFYRNSVVCFCPKVQPEVDSLIFTRKYLSFFNSVRLTRWIQFFASFILHFMLTFCESADKCVWFSQSHTNWSHFQEKLKLLRWKWNDFLTEGLCFSLAMSHLLFAFLTSVPNIWAQKYSSAKDFHINVVIKSKAPAKRSQHANVTYRNIVERNMLRSFGHRVAICWVLLVQVWKWSSLSQQHPTRCNTS